MFQPSKGHPHGVQLIHSSSKVQLLHFNSTHCSSKVLLECINCTLWGCPF